MSRELVPKNQVEWPIRVLIVDDSAVNRRTLGESLALHAEIEIVGKAADGEEALQLAQRLKPDVVTLDLEMPRMDGFTFLRILMSRQPTSVIVVSSYTQRENVFKALELGALDFVMKPENPLMGDLSRVFSSVADKVLALRELRSGGRGVQAKRLHRFCAANEANDPVALRPVKHVVAIASSTGGPSALLSIFARLPATSSAAFLVSQQMPNRFARTLADRLCRCGPFSTQEALDRESVRAGSAWICPGGKLMELVREEDDLRLKVSAVGVRERRVATGDRMLRSVAEQMRGRAIALILGGTQGEGFVGARAVRDAGGTVVVESDETSAISGVQNGVKAAGVATHVMPLPQIAEFLAALPE